MSRDVSRRRRAEAAFETPLAKDQEARVGVVEIFFAVEILLEEVEQEVELLA